MKQLFLTLLFSACTGLVHGQQQATDFTVNDCQGTEHHLFAELDAGKVIVLCWVMPCVSCTGPALTTYNVVQSFQANHPDKVFMYLCDDYANSPCGVINNWGNSLGMTQTTRFSNAMIKMKDYGSNGMPKVVVLGGGQSHSVYYNANNSVNASALQNAINDALGATAAGEVLSTSGTLLFPNPAGAEATLQLRLDEPTDLEVGLLEPSGRQVAVLYRGLVLGGEQRLSLDLSPYQNGFYFLRITDGKERAHMRLLLAH